MIFCFVYGRSGECEVTDLEPAQHYNVEFTFDSDVRCSIVVHYFCTEEITSTGVV